jgi:hypothetical protein
MTMDSLVDTIEAYKSHPSALSYGCVTVFSLRFCHSASGTEVSQNYIIWLK